MQLPAQHAYVARINRVVDYIGAHLAEILDLQTLAGVAHFSPWHFHRVFQAVTGETLADCVSRRRPGVAIYREDFSIDSETGVFNGLLCVPVRPL